MAKQYTTVHVITGEDLESLYQKAKETVSDGVQAAVDQLGKVVENGSTYRISVRDKDGNVKFKTTATVGAFGVGLAVILRPAITVVVGIAAALAVAIAEWQVVIEKEVAGSVTTEAVGA